jgi:hypothetical protein
MDAPPSGKRSTLRVSLGVGVQTSNRSTKRASAGVALDPGTSTSIGSARIMTGFILDPP